MDETLPTMTPQVVDLRLMVLPRKQPSAAHRPGLSPRRNMPRQEHPGYLKPSAAQWVDDIAFAPGRHLADVLDPASFAPAWSLPRSGPVAPAEVVVVETGTMNGSRPQSNRAVRIRAHQWPAVRLSSDNAQVVFVLGHDTPFHEALTSLVPALKFWVDDARTDHATHSPGSPAHTGWALLDRVTHHTWVSADHDAARTETQWRNALELAVMGIESGLKVPGLSPHPSDPVPGWADAAADWAAVTFPFGPDIGPQGWPRADDLENVFALTTIAIASGHPPADLRAWFSTRVPLHLTASARRRGYGPALLNDLHFLTGRRHREQVGDGQGSTRHDVDRAVANLVAQVTPERATLICDAGLAADDPTAVTASDDDLRFLAALRDDD